MGFKPYESFYYNKLNREERRVYDAVKDGLYRLKTEISFKAPSLRTDYTKILDYIRKDIPGFYYVDGSMYAVAVGGGTATIKLKFHYDKGEIARLDGELRKCVDEVKKRAAGSFERRVAAVHDYLLDGFTCEKSDFHENHSVIGALINRRGVCEALSKAFKLLCDELAIPAILILGRTRDDDDTVMRNTHGWNLVCNESTGRYYHIDVTWNKPFFDGGKRVYFLLSDRLASFDHIFKRDFYPPCHESMRGLCMETIDSRDRLAQTVAQNKVCFVVFGKRLMPRGQEDFDGLLRFCIDRSDSGAFYYKYREGSDRAIFIRT